jgi:hypothetical protein
MDNIGSAMLSLFSFSTLEDWNLLTYPYLDSNPMDVGPVYENRIYMLAYFLPLIYLTAFFFIDIFVGVVFLNYVISEKKIKNKNI